MFRVTVKEEKNKEFRLEKFMWHYPILLFGMPFFMMLALAAGTIFIMYPISLLLGWL